SGKGRREAGEARARQRDSAQPQEKGAASRNGEGLSRYALLAETREGYQNLCRLLTRMKLRAPKGKGAVTEDELAEYSRGLVCLPGGEHGPLTAAIAQKTAAGPTGPTAAGPTGRETLDRLIRIFGRENIYLELQRHYVREQEAINQQAIALAESFQ